MATPVSARHSKAFGGWGTPDPILQAAREVLGEIDLDPASDAAAQHRVGARTFYTTAEDGLVSSWAHARTVWLNPPGGLVRPFWRRLVAWHREGGRHHDRSAIWLGYSLEQLQTLQTDGAGPLLLADAICIPKRRIAFLDQHGIVQTSPTHANFLAYLGNDPNKFNAVFGAFGEVL